jgi:hypothetical protein
METETIKGYNPHKEGVLSSSEIKTENLAEIITSSRADYLIVIGDRNMKNRSCQAKKTWKIS